MVGRDSGNEGKRVVMVGRRADTLFAMRAQVEEAGHRTDCFLAGPSAIDLLRKEGPKVDVLALGRTLPEVEAQKLRDAAENLDVNVLGPGPVDQLVDRIGAVRRRSFAEIAAQGQRP